MEGDHKTGPSEAEAAAEDERTGCSEQSRLQVTQTTCNTTATVTSACESNRGWYDSMRVTVDIVCNSCSA